MAPPKLVFIFAQGCPACAEAKPHFKKLVEQLPRWDTSFLDIDTPGLNLDFPVQYTPTLYLEIGNKRYSTDPPTLKRDFTEANMRLWLEAAAAKYRATTP